MVERWEAPTYWAGLVRGYRLSRGWSQAELAQEWGRSVRTVKRWEAGSNLPNPYEEQSLRALMAEPEGKAA